MSESRSTLHGSGEALEKWKSFTPLREEGRSTMEVTESNKLKESTNTIKESNT